MSKLSPAEILRYSRHLIMPEVGMEGQLKLKAASVLLVGTGGLGAPVGLYLAAAGIGKLGLVDFDVVDATNLQRQVVFGESDIGSPKTEAARSRLRGLNDNVEIVVHDTRLSSENAIELFRDYDVVVDGTDNFATRYLVNDACVLLGKPDVYGSVYRFEGQATVFGLDDGPCYRCLFPDPPPPGVVPSCADGGVLGVVPGIIGSIQANEALKLVLGRGESLHGRLLLFDTLAMKVRELIVRRNPDCPVCGDHPTISELVDYDEFCGVQDMSQPAPAVPEITAKELEKRISGDRRPDLVDVREPHEYEICNLGGRLIPLGEVETRAGELDRDREIVVYCRTGARSATAVELLQKSGFSKVWNLKGGILAWSDEVDPTVPKY